MTLRRILIGVLLAVLVIALATIFVIAPANSEPERALPALVE